MTRRVGQSRSGAGRSAGGVPAPQRWSAEWWRAVERRRRRFAERLASELAHPDPDGPPGAMSDFVAGAVVGVESWPAAIEAKIAFDEAPTLIKFGAPFGWIEGYGGVVLWVHSPVDDDWSLVVPFDPFVTPVLVCLDDMCADEAMGDHCLGVYDDSPEARNALSDLQTGLIAAFGERRDSRARDWLSRGG